MTAANFPLFLGLVWQPQYDSPGQGFHVTPGDSGKGTKGGVIQVTWQQAVATGLVSGTLADAADYQLSAVLRAYCWGPVCDALPDGLDLMVANGRMMTGYYARLLQEALGFVADDVDGGIGPDTLGAAHTRDATTLILALHGAHYSYLRYRLEPGQWSEFGAGWTARLLDVKGRALAMVIPA